MQTCDKVYLKHKIFSRFASSLQYYITILEYTLDWSDNFSRMEVSLWISLMEDDKTQQK